MDDSQVKQPNLSFDAFRAEVERLIRVPETAEWAPSTIKEGDYKCFWPRVVISHWDSMWDVWFSVSVPPDDNIIDRMAEADVIGHGSVLEAALDEVQTKWLQLRARVREAEPNDIRKLQFKNNSQKDT
jgi:hypothetical protein